MKTRLAWGDQLKCFAMFLVLWGHAIQHLSPAAYSENPMYIFIYSFHMPLFMMVSGFFAGSAIDRRWRDTFGKKFVQLILPTIIPFVIFCFLIKYRGGICSDSILTVTCGFFSQGCGS